MDQRFLQANREARWAFGLTIAYLLANTVTAACRQNELTSPSFL